ncbi:unnamed protein product, partial [Medioppia subpectinata]
MSGNKVSSFNKIQLSILNSGLIPFDHDVHSAMKIVPQKPIDFDTFNAHIQLMRKYEVLPKIEFHFASKNETTTKHSTHHAMKEANDHKNTYPKKCLPYDFNRVVLSHTPDEPDSDYVNASYVDSILKPNAYIAAQGPNEFTINDFWKLIWEQNSMLIVMLTKVFDFIRVMCCQYWPMEENKPEMYGQIE